MIAAQEPRTPRDSARLLVLDPVAEIFMDAMVCDLANFFSTGDLLVVNEAATLPASLRVRLPSGASGEIRLAGQVDGATWRVVLFGAGDWRIPTELRDPPESILPGSTIRVAENLSMEVIERSPISSRLLTVRFDRSGADLWTALYAYGTPVQYSYLNRDLTLWSVQTMYSGRPWAVEMPSAGRSLSWRCLRQLREKGVGLASLTHAAGLSSTGDEELDAALPLPERFEIPVSTVVAVERAREAGGRIVAVGTTVVRALEGCAAQNGGRLYAGEGITHLVIKPTSRPAIVSGILTGIHDPSQSHFRLLRAFAGELALRSSLRHAVQTGYLGHEFGDSCLILPDSSKSPMNSKTKFVN